MLSSELDRRLRARGSRILSVAAHPGVAYSNIFEAGGVAATDKLLRKLLAKAIKLFLNSSEVGALATLYAATAPQAHSGGYYGPQGFQEMRGRNVGPARIVPAARDEAAAARLWQICEDLTGVRPLG